MFTEAAISLTTVLLIFFFIYCRKNFVYWKRKEIAHYGPSMILTVLFDQIWGQVDIGTIFRRSFSYHKGKGLRFFGSWNLLQPALVVIDLDLCKMILTEDSDHFVSSEMELVSYEYKHLFSLDKGKEWKEMRTKLTPTFPSEKMKKMFVLMKKYAEQLLERVEEVVLQGEEFDLKDLCSRQKSDIIASCAFGLDLKCIRDGESEFTRAGRFLIRPSSLLSSVCNYMFLNVSSALDVRSVDPRYTDLFTTMVKDTVEDRKKNDVERNDFIDFMMRVSEGKCSDDGGVEAADDVDSLKSEGKESADKGLTLEEMTAQDSLFFLSGFETAASTTSFCLYELTHNLGIQEQLREEIDVVLSRHEGEICYQALQEMTYMDQVVNETLRRYASLPFLTRVCTEPYRVPGSTLVIDKGVRVNIPTYAIHHDPEIYPDPYKFDPDRFSEHNSKDRHHYAFLPFGEGPRNCIGMMFGRMQVKIALASILSKYKVTPATDTPSRLEINPYSAFTSPKRPFSLRIERRTDIL